MEPMEEDELIRSLGREGGASFPRRRSEGGQGGGHGFSPEVLALWGKWAASRVCLVGLGW